MTESEYEAIKELSYGFVKVVWSQKERIWEGSCLEGQEHTERGGSEENQANDESGRSGKRGEHSEGLCIRIPRQGDRVTEIRERASGGTCLNWVTK